MKFISIISTSILMLLASCHTKSTEVVRTVSPGSEALPRAVIYQTNINVNDKVPVNVSPDGTRIVSFPAPTDVGPFSTPVELADGWLLDRRGGIGRDTRFLNYTYTEYSRLKEVPSISALTANIIKGARVTVTYKLDITLQEALADTASINDLIRNGVVQSSPRITL